MSRKKLKTINATPKGLPLDRMGVTVGVKCHNMDQSGFVLIISTWLTVVLRPTLVTEKFKYSKEPRTLVARGSVTTGRCGNKTRNCRDIFSRTLEEKSRWQDREKSL